MDKEQMRQAKKLVDEELVSVDAAFEELKLRRDGLHTLSQTYDMLLGADALVDRASVVMEAATAARASRPVKLTLDGTEVAEVEEVENLPSRVIRILRTHSPSFITPRQALVMLEREDWTTSSTSPISVVRNTLNDMEKKTPLMRKHPMGDQQIGYAWIEDAEWAAMQDDGSG